MGNRELYGKFALNISCYEFCCFNFLPKNMNCFPFQRSSKFHKLPFNLRKDLVKCRGEQIDLKTELKLLNNLFYLH
jgi:hypothetical protein